MELVINKLFGKFNAEIEIDKKLNILVGENGIGKSTIVRICNHILNNNFAELTKYYFDTINIYYDNNQMEIKYSDLFPDYNLVSDKIEDKLNYSREFKGYEAFLKKIDREGVLNQFMSFAYYGVNLSIKLDFLIDKFSYNRDRQIQLMKEVLQELYEENSNDKIKSFVKVSKKVNIDKKCYYFDFVENFKLESKMSRGGILISKKQNENFEKSYQDIINKIEKEEEEFEDIDIDTIIEELNYEPENKMQNRLLYERFDENVDDNRNDDNYEFNQDDLESDNFEEMFYANEPTDDDLEYQEQNDECEAELGYDDEYYMEDGYNIYEKDAYEKDIEKNRKYIETFKFKNIERADINYIENCINELVQNKYVNVNKLISELYYDDEFIKKIIEKIDNTQEEYKTFFDEFSLECALGCSNSYWKEARKKIEPIEKFYENDKNIKNIKDYLLPLMPKGSPYEFFIKKAMKEVKDCENYIFFRLYEIYNAVIEDLLNYKNPKIEKLERLLNKYIINKEIKIKPTGIYIFDKVMNHNTEMLEVNYEKNIELNILSAGEKKIIILLITSMFVTDSYFIIDEIENSLSIIWQESIITDLLGIMNNNHLIITTQSTQVLKNNQIQKDIIFLPIEEV